jgi:hypothetical protein
MYSTVLCSLPETRCAVRYSIKPVQYMRYDTVIRNRSLCMATDVMMGASALHCTVLYKRRDTVTVRHGMDTGCSGENGIVFYTKFCRYHSRYAV